MKTLLLFAVLALTINVFAQSKRPVNHKLPPISGSIENSLSRMVAAGLKTPALFSGLKTEKAIKFDPASELTSFQIVDSLYSWSWDITSKGWKLDNRTINIVYDGSNNMTSSTEQTRNGNTWVNFTHYIYTYDANHNQTSELTQNWSSNTWVNSSMIVWTYDANDNETNILRKTWTGSAWVNTDQTVNVYNANNNLLSELTQTWNGSAWTNSAKTTNTYDANYNLLGVLKQDWNGSAWDNTNKETNTYDANNNKLTSLTQMWITIMWMDLVQSTYTYDGNNNLVSETGKNWNGIAWENSTKKNYSYDANNNLINEIEQQWDGSQWVNSNKSVLTYNSYNKPTSVFSQSWDGSTWLNTLLAKFGFDADNFNEYTVFKLWEMDGITVFIGDSTHYYYHKVVAGIPALIAGNIAVYPNPSKGKFSITGNGNVNAIEIYDLQGNRIYSEYNLKKQTTSELDLSGYSKGIYLLKVINGAKIYTRKVIVQ